MRKLARTLPLVLVFALCLMSYALADIATGATFGVFIGIPVSYTHLDVYKRQYFSW